MEYEQKYKEALKVIGSLYNVVKYQSSYDALLTYQTIEKAFPELKESEDEKIRKELIERFKWELKGAEEQDAAGCSRQKDIAMFKRGLTWLEKQGEKKGCAENTTTVNDVVTAYTDEYGKRWVHVCAGDIDFLLDTKDLTFKEVDWNTANKLAANLGMRLNHKREFQLIAHFVDEINQCCVDCGGEPLRGWYWAGDECNDRYAYLFSAASGDLGSDGKVYTYWSRGSKNFKERVQPKPKQEWSEEDEKMIETICKEGNLKPSEQHWLKSFKPNHWKPSEFQLKCLEKVIPHNNTEKDCELEDVLTELYNDLKKL